MKITTEQIQQSTVRMLTLNEPFASLMAFHNKQETRKRDTKVRGLVCIHAAQKPYQANVLYNIAGYDQYQRIQKLAGNMKTHYGCIIAIGYLTATKFMGDHPNHVKEIEAKTFVEYNKDLWIWEFEDMTPIVPVSIKGKQGWKILTEEEKKLLTPL